MGYTHLNSHNELVENHDIDLLDFSDDRNLRINVLL